MRISNLMSALLVTGAIGLSENQAHAGDPQSDHRVSPVTVVVVRHAEKADDGTEDPDLSEAGRARSLALAEALAGTPVAAIYTTQLQRAVATAQPLAAQAGVTVSIRPITAGEAEAHTDRLVEEILANHNGETVVVVGHSNTVPLIVVALSGLDTAVMTECEYDHFYLVSATGPGQGTVIHARYGEAAKVAMPTCVS